MSKKLSRILAGTLSAVFVGQVLVYGDGTSQGLLHANANNLSVIGIYPAKKSNRVFRTKHFALMRKFRARGRSSLNDRHRLFQA